MTNQFRSAFRPANRLVVFCFLTSLGTGPVLADGKICAAVENDSERLACYDNVFRGSAAESEPLPAYEQRLEA